MSNVEEWFPILSALVLVSASVAFSFWAALGYQSPSARAPESDAKASETPMQPSDRHDDEEVGKGFVTDIAVEIDVDEFIEQRLRSGNMKEGTGIKRPSLGSNMGGLSPSKTMPRAPRNLNADVDGLSPPTMIVPTTRNGDPVLKWEGISCVYKAKGQGSKDFKALEASFGELRTGELMAIMGPSGSGKTTLLDVLSGRKATGTTTGCLEMFGKKLGSIEEAGKVLKTEAAYVPQEFDFFPMQTPEEAVMFVATVKHGDTSIQEVHELLRAVGLADPSLYQRPIGGTLAGGLRIRGCSGGERKRIALACALAMKPRLLMLDEITSGLDSESAHATMWLLKNLCVSRGLAAAVVIHQPDGYTFECFNSLVLNSNGKCVFSGVVSKLPDLYRCHFGCAIPSSIHEIPLDLLRRVKALPNGFEFAKPKQAENSNRQNHSTVNRTTQEVSFFRKLATVFKRNLVNHYLRNLTNLAARMVIYSMCSILTGAIFWQIGLEQDPSIVVGPFIFIQLISYLLPFATIPLILHEKDFFLFERSLGLYTPWIYCISQILLEAWVIIMASFVESCIIIPMCGFWNPEMPKWESFLAMSSALIASGLNGSSIVLLFSILLPSQDLAFLLGAGVVTIGSGVSGAYAPSSTMVPAVSWLQWISPFKYSLQSMVLVFVGKDDPLVEALEYDKPGTVSANLGALYLMFVVLAMASVIGLHSKRQVR